MYVSPTIDAGELNAILKEEFGCDVDLYLHEAASASSASASASSPSRPPARTGIITCHRHLLHVISSCILLRRKQISSISDPESFAAASSVPPTLRLHIKPPPSGRFPLWRQRAPPPVIPAARGDRPQVVQVAVVIVHGSGDCAVLPTHYCPFCLLTNHRRPCCRHLSETTQTCLSHSIPYSSPMMTPKFFAPNSQCMQQHSQAMPWNCARVCFQE